MHVGEAGADQGQDLAPVLGRRGTGGADRPGRQVGEVGDQRFLRLGRLHLGGEHGLGVLQGLDLGFDLPAGAGRLSGIGTRHVEHAAVDRADLEPGVGLALDPDRVRHRVARQVGEDHRVLAGRNLDLCRPRDLGAGREHGHGIDAGGGGNVGGERRAGRAQRGGGDHQGAHGVLVSTGGKTRQCIRPKGRVKALAAL